MKRILFFGLITAFFFISCEKSVECVECEAERQKQQTHESMYPVRCAVDGIYADVQTKVADAKSSDEEKINSVRLYVFDDNGFYDKLDDASGIFNFYVVGGDYDFVAVINGKNLPDKPASAAVLKSIVTELKDNAYNSFIMEGELLDQTINQSADLTITAARLVSKVTYSVTTDFDATLAPSSFKIVRAYMTNVVSSCRYDKDFANLTPSWINKMVYVSDDFNSLTYDVENKALSNGQKYDSNKTFYVYPNYANDSHVKDAWSARKTRLVLEADYDGETYYYPVTIPKIENNYHYTVNATIKGPGMVYPEDESSLLQSVVVTIKVQGWQPGGTINAIF